MKSPAGLLAAIVLLWWGAECKPGSFADRSVIQMLEELRPIAPPHCSRAFVTDAGISSRRGAASRTPGKRLSIGVGQTVCFRTADATNESSYQDVDIFHTITLERLEHYHPITQRYRFAIPELETKCKCECQASARTCTVDDYRFTGCKNSRRSGNQAVCYRTFFSDQPSVGCPEGHEEQPKLCCELKLSPFKSKTYTAMKLESPSAFAVLKYMAYVWNDHGRWEVFDGRQIRIHVDGLTQTQFVDKDKQLELSVSALGKSSNQLESGMYFAENIGYNMLGKLTRQPLNEITEHSFEKLGWFRINPDGQPDVFGDSVLIDRMHKAKVENCMEQRYQSILDANFYVNKDANFSSGFTLADSLEDSLQWVQSARVRDVSERNAVITENEGVNLDISLNSIRPATTLLFSHNASRVQDFTGLILVDKISRSNLNLTVFNASGILHGYVKHTSDSFGATIDSFTVQVPNSDEDSEEERHILVRIKPYEVNTQHTVCLRPDDGDSAEICRSVVSVHFDLETVTVHNEWHDSTGNCEECNQLSVKGFLQSLNPVSWISNVKTWSDGLVLVIDLGAFLIIIVIIYYLYKTGMSMIKCFLTPWDFIKGCVFKKKSSKKRNYAESEI